MKILIAEDDAVSRRILEAYLKKWGHQVVVTKDGAEAWQALRQKDAPRLALLDWMMPGVDGVQVCRQVRERIDGQFTYLILLTAKSETDDIVMALDSGADDYLVKPYNSAELRSRIGAGERIIRLQEELERANSELFRLARTDFLTQTLNRSAIFSRVGEELARAARSGHGVALYLLDVDHFKRINDTYGHASGDQVLVEVARRLREQCRIYDAAGRYGGEEFVVVVPGPLKDEVKVIGDRIRGCIAAQPMSADGQDIVVTASVGALWVQPGSTRDVNRVFKAADELLYQAKHAGRNCVVPGVLIEGQPSPGEEGYDI